MCTRFIDEWEISKLVLSLILWQFSPVAKRGLDLGWYVHVLCDGLWTWISVRCGPAGPGLPVGKACVKAFAALTLNSLLAGLEADMRHSCLLSWQQTREPAERYARPELDVCVCVSKVKELAP